MYNIQTRRGNMKILLITLLLIGSNVEAATPYIEYKNKNLKENFLRIGVQGKHFYFEAATKSAEAGYKFKKEKITFKGKVESTKKKTTLETEIRYTF